MSRKWVRIAYIVALPILLLGMIGAISRACSDPSLIDRYHAGVRALFSLVAIVYILIELGTSKESEG